ncbi:alpha-amylase, partial [Vibrio alfacsensis]
QPQVYRVIDYALGNTTDFKSMVEALDRAGVLGYADVVFNHMANEAQLRSDLQFPRQSVMDDYQKNTDKFQDLIIFGDLSEP